MDTGCRAQGRGLLPLLLRPGPAQFRQPVAGDVIVDLRGGEAAESAVHAFQEHRLAVLDRDADGGVGELGLRLARRPGRDPLGGEEEALAPFAQQIQDHGAILEDGLVGGFGQGVQGWGLEIGHGVSGQMDHDQADIPGPDPGAQANAGVSSSITGVSGTSSGSMPVSVPNTPSHLATTTEAKPLPMTLVAVRAMSLISSTARSRASPPLPAGRNRRRRQDHHQEDLGTPAIPLLVSMKVNIIISCWPKDRWMWAAWAMAMEARTRYSVDPSRLNEYPVGMTKLATWRGTPKRTISSSSLGRAASLEAVEKAMRAGSFIALKKPGDPDPKISITGMNTSGHQEGQAHTGSRPASRIAKQVEHGRPALEAGSGRPAGHGAHVVGHGPEHAQGGEGHDHVVYLNMVWATPSKKARTGFPRWPIRVSPSPKRLAKMTTGQDVAFGGVLGHVAGEQVQGDIPAGLGLGQGYPGWPAVFRGQPGSRPYPVGDAKADEQGEGGDDLEVEEGFAPHPSHGPDVPGLGDAHDDGGEEQGNDQPLDEADESLGRNRNNLFMTGNWSDEGGTHK